MLIYHRPVPAKIPKRRSRAGCIYCKEKKKKCNEEHPQCDRCMERGLVCQYEPVKPRKRRRTTSTLEGGLESALSVTSDPGPNTGYHTTFSAATSPSNHDALIDHRVRSSSSSPYIGVWDKVDCGLAAGGRGPTFRSSLSTIHDPSLGIAEVLPSLPNLNDFGGCTTPLASDPSYFADVPLHSTAISPAIDPTAYSQSPATTEFSPPPGRAAATTPDNVAFPEFHLGTPVSNVSLDLTAKLSELERQSSASSIEYFPRLNRRLLLNYFSAILSPLVVFADGPTNPLRQHVLPMANRSPAVMNAILALSAAHLEHCNSTNEERALDFHSQALQGLAQLITNQQASRDETLTVIILLIYYEVVRDGSVTVLNSHLRGALSVMRARVTQPSPTSLFLAKAFRYFDVLCALSFGTSSTVGSTMPLSEELLASSDIFATSGIDAVFGLVGEIWPLIHRLTQLLELRNHLDDFVPPSPAETAATSAARSARQMDLEASCVSVELALHRWVPKLASAVVGAARTATVAAAEASSRHDSRMQSVLSHAEACRYAALVFLARTIQRQHRSSPRVQIPAKHGLQACLRVVVFGGPMFGLLWPLFHTACEATDDVDRNIARTVFRHLKNRQGMQNVVHAWEIVEEIWHRRNDSTAATNFNVGGEDDWTKAAFKVNRIPILA